MILYDTCAIINLFENNKEDELLNEDVAVCSFNRDELIKLEHRHKINEHLRHRMKKFFNENKVKIIEVPVSPGQRDEERAYVNLISKEIAQEIPDPSDAVLAACALQNKADIITKDRHHLYTAKLENLFSRYGIKVEKRL